MNISENVFQVAENEAKDRLGFIPDENVHEVNRASERCMFPYFIRFLARERMLVIFHILDLRYLLRMPIWTKIDNWY